jgi:flavin-dependent dehydrogenase
VAAQVETYDVIVVGGGPAGSASAIILSRGGYRVLLIERRNGEEFKVGESLPPTAKPLLRELGLMERFEADRHLPSYGNQSAWGSRVLHSTDFITNPHGHGWHLNRSKFDAMLREGARDAGAETIETVRVNGCTSVSDDLWRLSLSPPNQSKELRSRRLIDCTGRSSLIARTRKVKRINYDRLLGFVALFDSPEAEEATDRDSLTLIEAVQHGWWYTALIAAGRRVVVYFTDADIETAASARHAEGFIGLLKQTEHIQRKIADSHYELYDGPRASAANTARLEQFVGDRWLAAGDAAASFDPLSSQGICTALYSGIKAGTALCRHLTGTMDALARYSVDVGSIYEAYLKNRSTFYSFEQRWPTSTFWKRRHEMPSAGRTGEDLA